MPSPRGARSLLGRVPVVGSSSPIVRLPPRSLLRTETCNERRAMVLAQYSFDSSKKKIKHWKAAVHWIQSAARSRRPSELGALRVFLHSFQLAGRGRVASSNNSWESAIILFSRLVLYLPRLPRFSIDALLFRIMPLTWHFLSLL